MIVYRTRNDLAGHIHVLRNNGKCIGLVPTMGALHRGHLSLVKRSTADNDATVVTIFVNPTQFNDLSDLERYPRTPEKDLELLRNHEVDVVFIPSVKEMYPESDTRSFDLKGLDRGMEGAYREDHFNGVAQIVTKLLELVKPHKAYFGQKDFQQLVIVKHLVRQLGLDSEIVACPIVREKDGLAMSSRNVHLSKEERKAASMIHRILLEAKENTGNLDPGDLKRWVAEQFDKHSLFRLEYFEIVDDKALTPVCEWNEGVNKVGCIAVLLGEVRLIDNLIFD